MTEFNRIVSKILNIDESTIHDGMSPKDIPDWDSMNYLLLISELERQFALSFTMDEVMNAKTLGDVRVVVTREFSKRQN